MMNLPLPPPGSKHVPPIAEELLRKYGSYIRL